jgi:hypothetical protein
MDQRPETMARSEAKLRGSMKLPTLYKRSVQAFWAVMLLISLTYSASSQTEPATGVVPSDDKTASAEKAVSKTDEPKVTFDEKEPGIVIVETKGHRLRIDTTRRSVVTLAADPVAATAQPARGNGAAVQDEDDKVTGKYEFDKGEEPFDYRIVNVSTPKSVPKGSWNIAFTHRFTQPVHPLSDSAKGLFGLDSFGVASFGVSYGVTDKLYLSAYRSPLCQKGICRVIELGAGYNWIAQDADTPIALTTYASIEGNDNFTEEYTYNLQAMLSARVGKRVYLFFSPAAHINSNGQRRFYPRPTDFFPRADAANAFKLPTHTASFGFGASVLITPNVLALFDFTPRTGFKQGQITPIFDSSFRVTGFQQESFPSIGFGLQRNIGRHSFTLTFSNTQGTTTSRSVSSTLAIPPKRLIIGFNLARRF